MSKLHLLAFRNPQIAYNLITVVDIKKPLTLNLCVVIGNDLKNTHRTGGMNKISLANDKSVKLVKL